MSSNAGQTVVPVSADVVARPPQAPPRQPPPQPAPRPVQPQPATPTATGGGSRFGRPGCESAHTLAIVALVLSFVCGIGLLIAPVSLVMAMRSERRIRASGGWLEGAAQARTARIVSWVAIGSASCGGWPPASSKRPVPEAATGFGRACREPCILLGLAPP